MIKKSTLVNQVNFLPYLKRSYNFELLSARREFKMIQNFWEKCYKVNLDILDKWTIFLFKLVMLF